MFSVGFIIIAIIFNFTTNPKIPWRRAIGTALYETGLITVVMRVCFILPNPNDETRELKEKIVNGIVHGDRFSRRVLLELLTAGCQIH
jgi:hypothetical protein